jgi:hypothetical protein
VHGGHSRSIGPPRCVGEPPPDEDADEDADEDQEEDEERTK